MISLRPNIFIERMVIERAGRSVYDERFHGGVNIIRGENSSGKSTILNFIHYGLGGDVSEWSETALLCDRVYVEVLLNGMVATLSRQVSDKSQQPLDISFGTYEGALSLGKWERYPYRRSLSKESFSQVMFRLLDMPEAANEDSGNITMHQVMRLLYADQLSPVDEIFAHEGFDNAKTREAVGKLLCGAFDDQLYANELEVRQLEKRYDSVAAELNSLFRALGQAGHDLTLNWVAEQRSRVEDERNEVTSAIVEARRASQQDQAAPTLIAQERAYDALVERQHELALRREERDSLELAISDSAAFMANLEEKLVALKDAALVAQNLGGVLFSTCPACYHEISSAMPGSCPLCKEPCDEDHAQERLGGQINEVALQLRQSKLIQERRLSDLADAEAALELSEADWVAAAKRYAEVQAKPTSEQELYISDLYRRLGYLERRDEDLVEKAKIIEVISSLSSQKSELNSRISQLKNDAQRMALEQEERLREAYFDISENVRSLIARDLPRQDSFENPKKVAFSFSDNKISVDGHTYFSASSRAILKSAFFLGFHAAALHIPSFRHPRFTMLDTIEDKGMEAARSHNFQRLIVEVSHNSDVVNQVIFGTAMIADELDNDSYTVGRFYTRDSRSLDIS